MIKRGRSKKQFCKNGHDTFMVGRHSHGGCLQCHLNWINVNQKYYKDYRNLHKYKARIDQAKWKKEHREEYNNYHRKLYTSNLNHKLASRIRDRINNALKDKVKIASPIDMLGCSIDFLKKYIESKFVEGMTWSNWNKYGWHLDHITPSDSFDLTDPIQFKQAVHYTNLQPLWAIDNWSKSNKILVNVKEK